MTSEPFFDQVRSDRYWLPCLFLVMCAMFALVGGFLVFAGTRALAIDRNTGAIPGLIFGGLFVSIFGLCAVGLLRRILHPPRRVRFDTGGIQVGEVAIPWREIRAIDTSYAARGRSVWLTVRTSAGAARKSFVIPGPPFALAEWDLLAAHLSTYFDQVGIKTSLGQ